MKTSELTGAALDWAVSAVHGDSDIHPYSTDWNEGGPIIEREWVSVEKRDNELHWSATLRFANGNRTRERGPTALIAAMRCYVASKLGDEVNVPEETEQ
jgi:hypothetical protein